MRKGLTIILFISAILFIALRPTSTTYYVSNGGSDSNDGTSTITPFATINKALSVAVSGDEIDLKCGDAWAEQIIIPVSDLTITSYGTGDKPLVTGFQSIGDFVFDSNNIWHVATGILHHDVNTVLVNGTFAWKSHYPNSSFLPIKALQPGYTSVATYLTGDENRVGSEIVIRQPQWSMTTSKITTQSTSGDTLGFSPSTNIRYGTTDPKTGWGYRFQNAVKYIDAVGEYCFDSATGKLSVYSISAPTVKFSVQDTLLLVNHKDNVTINNISFQGANHYNTKLDTSHNFHYTNCSINYCGAYGIYASKCRDLIIDNDSIQNCWCTGALLGDCFVGNSGGLAEIITDTCERARFTNNYVYNIGMGAGMGAGTHQKPVDGEDSQEGLLIAGDDAVVYHNVFKKIGFHAIRPEGRRDSIYYNYIDSFCLLKTDGGAIYTFSPDNYDSGMIVYRNIIKNGIGVNENQLILSSNYAIGLYCDEHSHYTSWIENTVTKCLPSTTLIINTHNANFSGNNLMDSVNNVVAFYLTNSNLTFKNNVYYSGGFTGVQFSTTSDIMGMVSDNNIFINAWRGYPIIAYKVYYTTLSDYVSATGFDIHSGGLPAKIIANSGTLIYNPTLSDSTIYLTPSYVNARGEYLLQNKITLKPFTSAILFKTNPYSASKYFYVPH